MKCGPEVKLGSKLLADVEQLKKKLVKQPQHKNPCETCPSDVQKGIRWAFSWCRMAQIAADLTSEPDFAGWSIEDCLFS